MLWLLLLKVCSAAVLGVDFGTEFVKNSLVAPNAAFEIVLTPDSQRKDASGLVLKPPTLERFYGSSGLIYSARFPENSLYRVKPLLGLSFDDPAVAEFARDSPGLQLIRTSRNTVAFNVSDVEIPVEEIVAMQLNEYIARGSEMLQHKTHSKAALVRDVALSVPASFSSVQREALVSSLDLAGANLIGLVNDGVSVAMNYANSPAARDLGEQPRYIIVYDSGSSQTSSTVISLTSNDTATYLSVEGFGSTADLGGAKLTSVLRDLLLKKGSLDRDSISARSMNRLWREAERAKHVLSANSEVNVHMESVTADEDLNVKVTRSEFEDAAASAIDAVTEPLLKSLNLFNGKKFSVKDIDAVVLAGGATRTPFVLSKLTELVGEQKISKNVNADEANVQGTTLRGVGISGIFKSKKIFNVEDKSLHVYEVESEGKKSVLFPRGAVLGSQQSIVAGDALVNVYEDGELINSYNLTNYNASLASIKSTSAMRCIEDPKVAVSFELNANGILELKTAEAVCLAVVDSTTSSSLSSDVISNYGATPTETGAGASSSLDSASLSSATSVSTESTSTAAAAPKYKTRRIYVNTQNNRLSQRDQLELRVHLRQLNEDDAERKQHSILHHQLESLLYKLRSVADEGSLDIANTMLEWIENGGGTVAELQENLDSAKEVYNKLIGEPAAAATTTTTTSSSVVATSAPSPSSSPSSSASVSPTLSEVEVEHTVRTQDPYTSPESESLTTSTSSSTYYGRVHVTTTFPKEYFQPKKTVASSLLVTSFDKAFIDRVRDAMTAGEVHQEL